MRREEVVAGLRLEPLDELRDLGTLAFPDAFRGLLALAQKVAVRRRIDQRAQQGFFGGLLRGGEHAVQSVIILHRDGIELVVVTARAGDGQAHQAAGDDVDAVVDDVVLVVEKTPAEGEEPERGERRLVLAQWQTVGGELLDDETVVGQVGVERADHVIAVRVRESVAALLVAGEVALRVGVARHIEPEASPALAVSGRGQQSIDGPLIGRTVTRVIAHKILGLLGRRRQARQPVRHPPQQGAGLRLRRSGKFALRLRRADERVDRRNDRLTRGREGGFSHRLQRPVPAGDVHVERAGRTTIPRVRRAHPHPLFEHRDLLRRKPAAVVGRRHLQILVLVTHGLKQQALGRVARDDRRAGSAAAP